jgi:DNA-binding transcriptional LysR family regulator
MELRHLRYFVSVAEAASVSKAALRVHICQPALSRQIRDLERELGLRLFDRIGRRIQLTTEGEDLLRTSRDVLAHAEALTERARSLVSGGTGLLRVGATPQAMQSVLARFLSNFHRVRPGVDVRLTEDGGVRLYELVRQLFDAACRIAHLQPRVVLESREPHSLITLAEAGQGVAIVPSTVQFVSKRVQIAPLLQGGMSLGVWGGVAWDPRRALPIYATRFIEDLAAYAARNVPGRRFERIGPPLPAPPIAAGKE